MNIVLIGMRGAGKTTIAKLLSKKLQKDVLETDSLVAERAGMTISDIVNNHGWDYFRDLESKIVNELTNQDDVIISCGGGVITRSENIKILKKFGKIFWLQVSVNTLLVRIGNDFNRPSITGKPPKEDMEETLRNRYKLYKNAADVCIDTEKLSKKEVVQKIIDEL